jgi:uncharacterized membrane protein YdjX (TVP38/TMEM64 family)
MNALLKFFMRMDLRAGRAVWVSLALFLSVAIVFLIGKFVLDLEPGAVGEWFEHAAEEWYAIPATIVAFTALAFVGFPQFALIGAAVFAFGPLQGFFYSWIATMVSGALNFYLARLLGAKIVRRYGGQTVNRISDFVGRNGFWASFIVRIVPSAPFIVVNMAAGISHMGFLAFASGMGLGIIPKTALVAFFGGSLMAILSGGGPWAIAALVAAGAAWIGFMLIARRWLRGSDLGMEAAELKEDAHTGDDAAER